MNQYPPSVYPARSRPSPSAAPQPPIRRISRLLLLLLGVIVLAYVPAMMEQIEYFRTRGEMRALQEALPNMNLKALSKAFTLVYRKVKPSVVHITSRRVLQVRDDLALLLGGRNRTIDEHIQASGVIVDPAGYIVTNQHVVEGTSDVRVIRDDGRSYSATKIGGDPGVDLAVLKIDADDLIAAEWGDSDKLEVGEMVWAIGNPYGLDQTASAGIVSAKGRRGVGVDALKEFLQTDVALNPGNSGGPLVDINGDVVGINTAVVGQGISFAIPSNLVREVYKQIRNNGIVVRGFLGAKLDLRPISSELAARIQLPPDHPSGVLVWEAAPGGPAQKAGIRAFDFIVEYNGQPVSDSNQLLLLIARTPVGTKVPVKVIREGKELTLEVTIDQRPPEGQ